jgi:hypothetical protein
MTDRLQQIKANWAEHLDSDSDAAWLVGECERLRSCLGIWKAAMRETCDGIWAREKHSSAFELAYQEREKALRNQETTNDQ